MNFDRVDKYMRQLALYQQAASLVTDWPYPVIGMAKLCEKMSMHHDAQKHRETIQNLIDTALRKLAREEDDPFYLDLLNSPRKIDVVWGSGALDVDDPVEHIDIGQRMTDAGHQVAGEIFFDIAELIGGEEYFTYMAMHRLEVDDVKVAISLLEQALAENPDCLDALEGLMVINLKHRNDVMAALPFMRRLYDLGEMKNSLLPPLINGLFVDGKYAEAEVAYQDLLNADPGMAADVWKGLEQLCTLNHEET